MTRILLATLILASLAGCEKYTEKTSPCFGRSGSPIETKAAFAPNSLLLDISVGKETDDDCKFLSIGLRA